MKLLIITQKVDKNDPILGFFHEWLREFGRQVESVEVICLQSGEHDLPSNMYIHSLGKELALGRFKYLRRLVGLLWGLRHRYDAVFVHMNPIYVVLAGWFWRISGKPITLWYTHKHVDWKLRIAAWFANTILTASTASFRLPSRKLHVTGHGIPVSDNVLSGRSGISEPVRMVTLGRISPIKKIEVAIEAVVKLIQARISVTLDIIGGPLGSLDEEYLQSLQELVEREGLSEMVTFVGAIPPASVREKLTDYDIMIHTSQTGSLDKVALEAMAAGVLVVSSNDSMQSILEPTPLLACRPEAGSQGFFEAIAAVIGSDSEDQQSWREYYQEYVRTEHGLSVLIANIVKLLWKPHK